MVSWLTEFTFCNQTELTVEELLHVPYLKPVTDLMINNISGRECYIRSLIHRISFIPWQKPEIT
jgi:hypothetical protein